LTDPISTPGFLFGWRLEKLLLKTARGLRILVPGDSICCKTDWLQAEFGCRTGF
jgi:hypothetical protein